MYRIKLASGAETTYQTIDELTSALQGGEVNAEALIYHQRADRWLSVINHPHYQIALARLQTPRAPAATEASRRQVVQAVRPEARSSNSQPPATRVSPEARSSELPPTVVRAQLMEVVAEMQQGPEALKSAKKLTIPAPRKSDPATLRAHENVLEGVTVSKPQAPTNGNGNGHTPPAAVKQQTTVLPIRAATQPATSKPTQSEGSRIPDLGDGLDLVDPEQLDEVEHSTAAHRGSNGKSIPSATPQVDKLLSLLEPNERSKTLPPHSTLADIEVIDLNAPLPDHAVPRGAHHALPAAAAVALAHAPVMEANHVPTEHVVQTHHGSSRRLGLVAGAAVVIIAVGMMLWHPWSTKRGGASQSPTVASIEVPRTEAFGGLTSVTGNPNGQPGAPPSAANRDSAGAHPVKTPTDSEPSIIRVAAPRINVSAPITAGALPNLSQTAPTTANISASTLAQHYAAAYNDARSEMEMRMLQIGFTQLFLRSRLTTSAGVQDTRRLITSAGNAIRQYRTQEGRIERGYQDTVGVAGRTLGWSPRDLSTWNAKPTQREAPETVRLTGLFLSQMDSLFSLLLDQDGKYQTSGETIVFDDADAAHQYGVIRAWLSQQADSYSGSGDSSLPGTLRQVLKAIGSTRLPQERHK